MAAPFRPSQVDLLATFPPLTGTMGRSEREAAAALIVRALAARGDEFRPIHKREVGEVLREDAAKREPWASLNTNPFFRPDVYDLVDKGFARWTTDAAQAGPLEFTETGIEAMRRWVASNEPTKEG